MATNWTFESGVSAVGSGATLALATGTVTPQVGDLMVMSGGLSGTGTLTSYSISDSSSGGASWTATLGAVETSGTLHTQGWWKIANAADAVGITVTATGVGLTGPSHRVECDIFRLPLGFSVVGADIAAGGASGSAVSTLSWSPASGSGKGFTDALALTSLYTGTLSNGGISSTAQTNTFTGTSAQSSNMAVALTTNQTVLAVQYIGGVQASGTAGTNVWKNTWTTAHGLVTVGSTFIYQSIAEGSGVGVNPAITFTGSAASNMFLVMGG